MKATTAKGSEILDFVNRNDDTLSGISNSGAAWRKFLQNQLGSDNTYTDYDLEVEWLTTNGATGGTLHDLWTSYLTAQGYAANEDGLRDYLANGTVSILSDADWYISASEYDSVNDRLTDQSGNGNHAQLGSTSSPDTNDPTVLSYDGTKYAWFPGAGAQDIQTPDVAALDITGDLTIVAKVASEDYSVVQRVLSKFDNGTTGSYTLHTTAATALRLQWVDSSPTAQAANSTTGLDSVGISATDDVWVAVSVDVDNGSGDADIKFWYSTDTTNDPDLVSWTQLGTTVNLGFTTDFQASVEAVQIGARRDNDPLNIFYGKIYYAAVGTGRLGTDYSMVAEFDPNNGTVASDHSTITNGSYVWTVNRVVVLGTKPIWIVDEDCLLFDGGDDYLTIADANLLDIGASDEATMAISYRATVNHRFSAYQYLLNKRSGTANGWALILGNSVLLDTRVLIDGGATDIALSGEAVTDMARTTIIGTRTPGDLVRNYLNGVAKGTDTDTSLDATNAIALQVGRSGTTYFQGAFYKAAFYKGAALDAGQVAMLDGEL